MKAQISEAALLGAAKSMLNVSGKSQSSNNNNNNNGGRIVKNKSKDPAVTEEMQVYFSKLKELVPFMPRHRKLSKLEIIQYVIDYICDLQCALETHPTTSMSPSSVMTTIGNLNVNRQPLGVIANVTSNANVNVTTSSTSQSAAVVAAAAAVVVVANPTQNTCAAQEAHQLHDKIPSHLDDLNTRPVSC